MRSSAIVLVVILTLPVTGFAQQQKAAQAQARCEKIKQAWATACAKNPKAGSCTSDALQKQMAKVGCSQAPATQR